MLVDARRPTASFTSILNCRQQQTHQNANDGNDDQEFDECKTASSAERIHNWCPLFWNACWPVA
jgi:hypothetical protein